ncbi:bifunctional metallophosphatase/5'-nucleotidase [Aetokthonos hydrillicola Thurmond2011]|jgi:5'-nucleotidase|uniref:Bifunctional metallophosphatase/5'-nucleotidase n=1 Tax=Aetokthonos hydrillicola Thurmond2011 TaxID=2712845 RepID=A0AAP5MDB8_9CYAN|nr:bifunctional UDP-sugar hydrolase/5'-nucleotidase [Aetokthonos hydrillicola]MBO3463581.1 bifunctional metallophosphatase/5'-nucleotidase [Aetokthonos hydrillicola CCALA 1050]MBW4585389.1 bifunctional metallophosphatase/5'-nucleotidase [Aetokthonos hydrillicola CCALA 1050]MDR9899104.1 bifunctional metallophosphatase/5'-nucleotidase [Aetokthonos hydrillicola Thurmond2011]
MNTERFKKFTILHSNDMHGDFLAEASGIAEGHVIGGMSLLSGYINKVRQEEKNVLFVISGDMLQGSMIDTEYKGLSTIEVMNYLAPDVVTLGNHELDYGLPHLLFLEKMANFPIVNANLYIKKYNKRLMNPYVILNVDGFDIMFIGIVTEEALRTLKRDRSIGTFVSLEDAATEIGKICNAYKNEDIDLTVLLTHIGFENDQQLAAMLDPEWGVDLIIGGHSHTFLEQPDEVNNILITQAGVGTDQIGRFDIVVDDDTNSIVEWKWQLLPVDSNLAQPDPNIETLIATFKQDVDRKYNRLLGRLARQLTHPRREEETELGNLIADIFAQCDALEIVLVASGAIRGSELGPLVTLSDLRTVFPYDDTLYKFRVSGVHLPKIFTYIMNPENKMAGEGEYFQVSKGIQAVYNHVDQKLESLIIHGQPVDEAREYTICIDGYRYENSLVKLGITHEELGNPKVISKSCHDVLEEYFGYHQNLNSQIEGRLIYK